MWKLVFVQGIYLELGISMNISWVLMFKLYLMRIWFCYINATLWRRLWPSPFEHRKPAPLRLLWSQAPKENFGALFSWVCLALLNLGTAVLYLVTALLARLHVWQRACNTLLYFSVCATGATKWPSKNVRSRRENRPTAQYCCGLLENLHYGLYLEPDFQVAILCYTVICFMTRSDYKLSCKNKNIRVTVCPSSLAIPNSGTTRPNNFAWVNISNYTPMS